MTRILPSGWSGSRLFVSLVQGVPGQSVPACAWTTSPLPLPFASVASAAVIARSRTYCVLLQSLALANSSFESQQQFFQILFFFSSFVAEFPRACVSIEVISSRTSIDRLN
jgi:hypothetical protein